ncbi:MAG: hypothetical protein IPN31_05890 [Bacteroidetes bacterium]|nr:hypothetical protein [Bacteroidota bacterium]
MSKWIVLRFDIVITIFTYGLAYILRFNFNIEIISFSDFVNNTLATTAIFALCFLIFKSYDGIIRHSGIADAKRLIKAGITATIICISISLINQALRGISDPACLNSNYSCCFKYIAIGLPADM